MLEVQKIRRDFPFFENSSMVFLDSAATSLTPRPVIEEIKNYYENFSTSVHRGNYSLAEKTLDKYRRARKTIADFIGASSEEVIFTKNATEGLNLVSLSLGEGLPEGSSLLVTEMEHHSNLIPWQLLASRKNLQLEVLEVSRDCSLGLEKIEQQLSDEVSVMALTGASNVAGTFPPLKEVIERARNYNTVVVVDGAQLVPHRSVNVKALDLDFLAFSAHKALGPTGLGILYGKKEFLNSMPPLFGGGEMVDRVTRKEASWERLPLKFEAGTPPIAQVLGFKKAIDYLKDIGMERIREHDSKLALEATSRLDEIEGVEIIGSSRSDGRSSLVSFNLEGIESHELATFLDLNFNLALRAGSHCAQPLHTALGINSSLRASFYLYNELNDVEKLVEGVREAKKVFS